MLERTEYPLRYPAIVRGHAQQYDLDPALLAAVIYSESRFRPHVRSPQGAIGLMQLLPSTAEGIATRTGGTAFVASDLDDPEINVRYGCWYLRHLRAALQGPAERDDARARGLQRGHGERRRVGRADAARPAAADPGGLLRDPALPEGRRARPRRLRAPVSGRARHRRPLTGRAPGAPPAIS